MNLKRTKITAVTFLLTSVVGLLILPPVMSQEGCVTGNCHAPLAIAKNKHPVLEPCETCHLVKTTKHPKKNEKTFQLTSDVPELCFMCHAQFGANKYVHSPVKNGMCTTCHNPHASEEKKLLARSPSELCTLCHSDKLDHKYLHGPTAVGDCTVCHKPHESQNRKLVIKEGAELCYSCHQNVQETMKKPNLHPAVMSGCTSCHNPHGSAYKLALINEGDALCFQCHPDIAETVRNAHSIHPPIKTEKGCASCHSPHASNGKKLMEKSGMDVCLTCHTNFIDKKKQTVLHGPIKDGQCTGCHSPHASQNDNLLAGRFSDEFYIPYAEQEYSLCFTCHNRDLLKYPDTSFATGFRDGERNLHYIHVNRRKGRSCKACHTIHGGKRQKLIADSVPFGKWGLPLRFEKTETGGSCAPGCHKKYTYDREGKKSPETKAKESH